jgi:hypothetical protein
MLFDIAPPVEKPPAALQDVALVELHVSVADWPLSIVAVVAPLTKSKAVDVRVGQSCEQVSPGSQTRSLLQVIVIGQSAGQLVYVSPA